MTLIHCSPLSTVIIAKKLPQTVDAKQQFLMPLSESTSLSHLFCKKVKQYLQYQKWLA
jgi:hypothetical protein